MKQKMKLDTNKMIINLVNDKISLQNLLRQKDLLVFNLLEQKYGGKLQNARSIK